MPETRPLIDRDRLTRYLKHEARHWGVRIRSRRQALGLSLQEVADLAGTTPQTIHKVEKGEILARDHLRIALAFALCVEVADLFPIPTREVIHRETAA